VRGHGTGSVELLRPWLGFVIIMMEAPHSAGRVYNWDRALVVKRAIARADRAETDRQAGRQAISPEVKRKHNDP